MEKYWRSTDEIETGPVQDKQDKVAETHNDDVLSFLEGVPLKATASRRDFMKIMSFSVASAALLASLKQEKSTVVKHEVHQSLVRITGRDLPANPQVWEQTFQQAAAKGEPLAKEPGMMLRLASWWNDD